MQVPLLSGLSEIASRYDVFLIDAWGVLHDGHTLYPGTLETLRQLNALGKRAFILSNSSRPNNYIEQHLVGLGVPKHHIEQAVTSGEITRDTLKTGKFGNAGYYIGLEQPSTLLDDVGINRVSRPQDAQFVLVTAVVHDEDTLADYEDVLSEAQKLGLPLVCANPDIVAIHAARRKVCAGALAARYAEMGGEIHLFGKPHAPIYEACLFLLKEVPKDRMVAIGDAFPTDIKGASAAGIDSVLVTSGIHQEVLGGEHPSQTLIDNMAEANRLYPVAAIPGLLW